jgi:serine protease Do
MKTKISAGHQTLSALLVSAGVLFAPATLGLAPVHAAPATAAVAGLPDFADMVEKVGPAVVNIRTTERLRQPSGGGVDEDEMQEFFRRFFGGQMPTPRRDGQQPRGRQQQQAPVEREVQRGVGSGFITSADGYVLTNAHVVVGADEVYVTLTDKREFKAKVLGSDTRTDVALLKIDGSNLPVLKMGDSNRIRVGEWVVAIGSPFNLENSVTAGIISAKSRDTGEYLPLIQSDVAVNPGNSGGPLINMRGEVIGINSQIATLSGAYNGISFAVPIDEAMRVADQLKATGKVTRGRIGVQIGPVTRDVAESLGLKDARGAEVSMVEEGGPAAKAGLRAGDIVIKFNGSDITGANDLPRLVGNTKPNARATITVWRQGKAVDLPITVAELESDQPSKGARGKSGGDATGNALGLKVSDLSAAEKKELGVPGGVKVDAAEGVAASAGIQADDVLLQLNNSPITDAKQFGALVSKLDPKRNAVVLVRRGDAARFLTLRPAPAPAPK